MTTKGKKTILIVDDDLAFRVGTQALLEDYGYSGSIATSGEEAKQKLSEQRYDLVLSDLVMPGMNGLELLQHIVSSYPAVAVIMITGFASINTAVEAMRLGARDYVTKPCSNDELLIKIRRALDDLEKERELKLLREEVCEMYGFDNIVGQNSKIKDVYKLVRQVADTDVTALVLGETGTGKELVAKAIHYNSARRTKPFIVINCSALSETLLESELFGHEKGAFTGAHRQRIGKFEEAEGGTIFLDEIGDVPPHIQTKLLRVLQEKEIQRVGGNEIIHVNVRVVAATNRNLQDMIGKGEFREDLYYRLNVFPIQIPSLRERLDDLALLVDHFLNKHGALSQNRVKKLSPSLFPSMMDYEWKGNIRELENLIKRAIIKTPGDTITSIDVPSASAVVPPAEAKVSPDKEEMPFKEYMKLALRDVESRFLLKMLDRHRGNIKMVAQVMEVDRKTIYRMIENCGIDLSSYRDSNSNLNTEDVIPH